jgi:hypothetical protein
MSKVNNGDVIPASFTGIPGILLATGPSLTRAQIEYIRPLHAAGDVAIFGLNDAYKWCDFLDVFYFCDPRWLDCNPDAIDYSHGEIWTQDEKVRAKYPGKVKRCAGTSGQGLCKTPNRIHFGGNSGYQLLNLAWHFGIREFYLLGYNMDVPQGKKQHMFGPHPKPLNTAHNYKSFVSGFRQIAAPDRALVTNCTYPSALIDCFKQQPLDEALPRFEDGTTRHIRITEPKDTTLFAARPSKEAASNAADRGASATEVQRQDRSVDRNRSVLFGTTTRDDSASEETGRRRNLRDQ